MRPDQKEDDDSQHSLLAGRETGALEADPLDSFLLVIHHPILLDYLIITRFLPLRPSRVLLVM